MVDRPLLKIERLNPALFKFVVELREVKVRIMTDLRDCQHITRRKRFENKETYLLTYDQPIAAEIRIHLNTICVFNVKQH